MKKKNDPSPHCHENGKFLNLNKRPKNIMDIRLEMKT